MTLANEEAPAPLGGDLGPGAYLDGTRIKHTTSGYRQQLEYGASLPAQALARLLLGGPVGLALYRRMLAEFPDIRRAEAFLAAALAVTDLAAQLLAAEAEVEALRRQIGECGR